MKRTLFLIIGAIAFTLLLMTASPVRADNGPHGGYTATTDACAGCHRAHTAAGPRLLVQATTLALCMSCHGSTATGADTNVADGLYLNRDATAEAPAEGLNNRGLKAGGFTNATMDTNLDGAAASASVTSSHLNDGSTGTAWGNGLMGSGPGMAVFSLSCTSCHDPHGRAGTARVATYRLLRAIPTNSGASVGVNVTDEVSKLYSLTDTDKKTGNQYFGEGYSSPGTTWETIDPPERQLTAWCSQCHTRYTAISGAGSTSSGDAIFTYRHMANGVPGGPRCTFCHDWTLPTPPFLKTTAGANYSHDLQCLTCHVAHGSSASMGAYSGAVRWPDGSAAPSGNSRSSLLRLDSRGVCESCHGK